jgi:ribosomal-protein-alanine N-acetyltransferase
MGLALEAATDRVEVLVCDRAGEPLVREAETVEHGHTRRLTPMVAAALARAKLSPRDLGWIAVDVGPGSFTGVRVGLATAEALALASGASISGASSLAALALSAPARRTLLVPLILAGRKDLYAGFYRADTRGQASLLAAPRVAPLERLLLEVEELRDAIGSPSVRFVGPGVARERASLESAYPNSTVPGWRLDGLSAEDLARAARSERGPAAGLPKRGEAVEPLYVRSAQAEEKVRRRVQSADPPQLRDFVVEDVPAVVEIEQRVFTDPWPASFFTGELRQPLVHARIAERDGELAGYLLAWLGAGVCHLGNLAVVPGRRRRGIARALLEDLLEAARVQSIQAVTLEVRVSNYPAQGLYRAYGFRVAGVRRGYYRDTGEDALVMEWRPGAERTN